MAKLKRRLTIDRFMKMVLAQFDELSPQLKRVAQLLDRRREHVGILGVEELARQCRVQPSSVVRFAKQFGLSGFSDMRRIFRDGLSAKLIIDAHGADARPKSGNGPAHWLDEFFREIADDLRMMTDAIHSRDIEKIQRILSDAPAIWIAAGAAAQPEAVYLAHGLRAAGRRVMFADATAAERIPVAVRPGDVMVAIGALAGDETAMRALLRARNRGARLISIVENGKSPLARAAEASMIFGETQRMSQSRSFPLIAAIYVLLSALQSKDVHRRRSVGRDKRRHQP